MGIFGADIWAWHHAGAYGSGTSKTPPKVGPTTISESSFPKNLGWIFKYDIWQDIYNTYICALILFVELNMERRTHGRFTIVLFSYCSHESNSNNYILKQKTETKIYWNRYFAFKSASCQKQFNQVKISGESGTWART